MGSAHPKLQYRHMILRLMEGDEPERWLDIYLQGMILFVPDELVRHLFTTSFFRNRDKACFSLNRSKVYNITKMASNW